MNYEGFIALRYFRAKRRTGFISIITYVSVAGIMIGVGALDIVLSAFNGFEDEVRSRLINADAHIHVRKYHHNEVEDFTAISDSIRQMPRVVGASPVIAREAVLRSQENNQPVLIKALEMASAGSVTGVTESLVTGTFDLGLQEHEGRRLPGIVLGRFLAENLRIFKEGSIVTVFALSRQASIMAQPKVQQFIVTGLSEIGFYEYDKALAYISIEEAQKLFKIPGAVTRIEVKLDDFSAADEVAPVIEEGLGGYPYAVRTWFEQNRSLYSWMTYEKLIFTLVLSLIIMVAAFNIVSSLVMIVMEKTREIGILKSMGASSRGIMKIFLTEGIIIGVLGTVLGTILAYALCRAQQEFGLVSLPPEVYIIDKLPVVMQWADFVIVAAIGLILCLLAALYPAYRASKLEPVEAIRYE